MQKLSSPLAKAVERCSSEGLLEYRMFVFQL